MQDPLLSKRRKLPSLPDWVGKVLQCLAAVLLLLLGATGIENGLRPHPLEGAFAGGVVMITGQLGCLGLIWRRWGTDRETYAAMFGTLGLANAVEHSIRWQAGKEDLGAFAGQAVLAAMFVLLFIMDAWCYRRTAAGGDKGETIQFEPEGKL